jgi:hypothetical protein
MMWRSTAPRSRAAAGIALPSRCEGQSSPPAGLRRKIQRRRSRFRFILPRPLRLRPALFQLFKQSFRQNQQQAAVLLVLITKKLEQSKSAKSSFNTMQADDVIWKVGIMCTQSSTDTLATYRGIINSQHCSYKIK